MGITNQSPAKERFRGQEGGKEKETFNTLCSRCSAGGYKGHPPRPETGGSGGVQREESLTPFPQRMKNKEQGHVFNFF